MFDIEGEQTTARVFLSEDQLGQAAHEQLRTLVDHAAFRNPVCVMSDAHWGKGSVIGFTMELGERVVPNTIGVDIGCGLYASNVGPELSVSGEELDRAVRSRIPMGSAVRSDTAYDMTAFPWQKANAVLERFEESYGRDLGFDGYDRSYFISLCRRVGMDEGRAADSIGTLGGGNHFIEFARSERTGDVWVVVHSGSRKLGYEIATYWQERATEHMDTRGIDVEAKIQRIREEYEGEEIGRRIDAFQDRLTDRDRNETLDYLEGAEADGYFIDMIFAQQYAAENRREMVRQISSILDTTIDDEIESVHNYIDFRDLVIRKGATRAYEDERFLVPFNMRDGTLICEGKSNPDWNWSAPHGAGRVMSRRQATREVDLDAFRETMADVFSTSVNSDTLDEAPQAYKDATLIERAIEPTARITDRLDAFHNIKAS
ncbi:RtcB family protein [Halocatena pleomorpha]|uniref:tRNA-splicing ligase RtcB n=1 Tax=Halocatena pleomorpha TaxID=1785090 RepID=A0A3P3R2H8_9EURY|nr:RtcB family protein [Halocatena pleomorpha]RRJ27681.1 RNA-splicing ligase RtcB [Halocatena pleomorpha]